MLQDVEIRCNCAKRVLLAVARHTEEGRWVIHLRAFKGSQLIMEAVCEDGPLRVRCRECMMWHLINVKIRPTIKWEDKLPDDITLPPVRIRA